MLDNRGTGCSAESQDPSSYRCERLVEDVETLRVHLGLERLDLLAHSSGGNIDAGFGDQHR
ncbi:alpha/beta fold hydrolase [Micromonospora sp. NPDC050495]|uniref:alpha/beta fold hydrolase n=1 Tax=Micromonospora sp. NPDC050495 TaxID=3154936 RepID=UPI0033BFC5DB